MDKKRKIQIPRFQDKHRRMLGLVKENRFKLFLAMCCMFVVAATTAASAYLIKPALDDVFVNKDARMLALIPMVIVIVFFVRGLGMYGQAFFMSYVGEGVIRHIRNMLYNKITDMPLSFLTHIHELTAKTLNPSI